MNILRRAEELILMLFWGYRDLRREWEITNRDLDMEIAKKHTYKNRLVRVEAERNQLIKRCYDAIVLVEETRLKQSTKDKIIDKLRGLE